MMRFLIIVLFLITLAGLKQTFAQASANKDPFILALTPHSKDAIFKTTADYTFEATSIINTEQVGRLSYVVTTETGKRVTSDTAHVTIAPKGKVSHTFQTPYLKPGFYKINFMINVSDYDDTVRRAFGVQPEQITSPYSKPADFDAFWQNAKQELAKVPPQFKTTEIRDSSKQGRRVFLIEMKSLNGLTIRGWLTEPITTNKNKKFVVLLGLPGYQVTLNPLYGTDPDIAILSLNVRGAGNSRDVISVRRDSYITLHLEDKNKYILRGVIMDCIRAVDYIYSRPELRHDNIIAAGGSMGGYLAVALAALDKRVNFCSAANPILCDVRNLVNEVDWPFIDIKKYVGTRPGLSFDKVLKNLDYFDAKNFADEVQCPTLVGLGLVDPIAPPNNVYTMYNNLQSKKHIIIFRDLAHEIGLKFNVYEGRWMRDQFALF